MAEKRILAYPVELLGFSREFCIACQTMGVSCLREILAIEPAELLDRGGFSYHWLAELSDYLEKEGLLSLLQPLPGTGTT